MAKRSRCEKVGEMCGDMRKECRNIRIRDDQKGKELDVIWEEMHGNLRGYGE